MRLAFKINEQLCEFGPKEFAVMTGLNFNGPLDTPKSSKFHNSVFNGKCSIFLKDIHKAFDDESKRSGSRSMKALQLALLYLLFGILLVKDRCNKKIELGYLHLIDDLDMFDKLIGLVENQKKLAFDAYGFTFPIQIWAYEIMPSLASHCARPVIDNDHAFPRMMRWRVEKPPTPTYDDIHNFFNDTQFDSMIPFEITKEEKSRIDVLGAVVYYDGINQIPTDDNGEESEDILNSSDGESMKDDMINDGRLLNTNEPAELDRTHSVNSRRRKLDFGEDKPVVRVVKKVRPQMSASEENRIFQLLRRSPRKHPSVPPRTFCQSIPVQQQPKLLPPARFPRHLSHETEHSPTQTDMLAKIWANNNEILNVVRLTYSSVRKLEADIHELRTNIISHNVKVGDDGEEILRTDAAGNPLNEDVYCSHPVKDNSNASEMVKGDSSEECNASIADLVYPFDDPLIPHSESFPIMSSIILSNPSLEECMMEADPSSKISEDVEIVDALERLPVSYIITHLGAIEQQHVTRYDPSAADYSLQSSSTFEEWYKEARLLKSIKEQEIRIPHQLLKWANAEWFDHIWKWTGWLRDDEALVSYPLGTMSHRMMPYVCGQMPSNGAVAWKDVDNIYGVGHVLTNHWVCYAVSIPQQKITVYDSLSNVNEWNNIKEPFMRFAKNLIYLCQKGDVFISCENCLPLRQEWDIEYCTETPQQTNNHDCGIMALKFLECMVSGRKVNNIDPERCGIFRHDYCDKIMNVSALLLKTDMEKGAVKKK
ncbi:hypothetical protein C2S52_008915 [Perilla frutescens var. hirtella]|nr:hypothetical protein C2S52_008915 [Perilla frutescens var. hirtella]